MCGPLGSAFSGHAARVFTEDHQAALVKLADFSDNALRLNEVRSRSPASFAWLARTYGRRVPDR